MHASIQAAHAGASSQQPMLAQDFAPLASVLAIFRGAESDGDRRSAMQQVRSLSNVTMATSAFLDVTASWNVLHTCEHNSVPMLFHIAFRKPTESSSHYRAFLRSKGLEHAVRNDNLQIVQWLCGVYSPTSFVWKTVEDAAALGRTEILKWLTTRYEYMRSDSNLMLLAAKNGHLETLNWIATYLPNNAGGSLETMDAAIKNGILSVVEQLHERCPEQTED